MLIERHKHGRLRKYKGEGTSPLCLGEKHMKATVVPKCQLSPRRNTMSLYFSLIQLWVGWAWFNLAGFDQLLFWTTGFVRFDWDVCHSSETSSCMFWCQHKSLEGKSRKTSHPLFRGSKSTVTVSRILLASASHVATLNIYGVGSAPLTGMWGQRGR